MTFSKPLIASWPMSNPVAAPVLRSISTSLRRLRIVERIKSIVHLHNVIGPICGRQDNVIP